jgi:hypothetical protein
MQVDTRIVNETKNRTATGMGVFGKAGIIDLPVAVGGWPVYKTTDPPAIVIMMECRTIGKKEIA